MPANLSYLQTASSAADSATYTFAAQNLGVAAADRAIIVAIGSRKTGAAAVLSSVTIGGVAATIVTSNSATSTNTGYAGLVIATVPTGTTGDIVITFAAGAVRCTASIYRATGINPTASSTLDVDGPTMSGSLAVTAGGVTVGQAVGAINNPFTWTNLTEDYDANDTGETTYRASAASTLESVATTKTITATATSTSNESPLTVAHFPVATSTTRYWVGGTNKWDYDSGTIDQYTAVDSNTLELSSAEASAIGQSFKGTGQVINQAFFKLKKVGAPTGAITYAIYAHTGTFGVDGVPTGTALAVSDSFDASTLTTSFVERAATFTAGNRITLTSGTNYVIAVRYSGGNASNYVSAMADVTELSHEGNAYYNYGAAYSDNSYDIPFRLITDAIYAGTTGWATTSGGAPTAAVPTLNDDVIFDANSFSAPGQVLTCTVNVTAKSIDWSAVTNNPALHLTRFVGFTTYGKFVFSPNMTITGDGVYKITLLAISGGGTADFALHGHTPCAIYIKAGGYTIVGSLTIREDPAGDSTSWLELGGGVTHSVESVVFTSSHLAPYLNIYGSTTVPYAQIGRLSIPPGTKLEIDDGQTIAINVWDIDGTATKQTILKNYSTATTSHTLQSTQPLVVLNYVNVNYSAAAAGPQWWVYNGTVTNSTGWVAKTGHPNKAKFLQFF